MLLPSLSLSFWHLDTRLSGLTGVGNAALLDEPLTAFFASRTCPGSAIRAAMDWAVAEARSGRTIIGGFHSPLERSVLEVLLAAHGRVVIALARDVGKARLPNAWRQAALRGEIAVVSVTVSVTVSVNGFANPTESGDAKKAGMLFAASEPGQGRAQPGEANP